ncbi:MAG: hypothetical protein ABGX16_08180 [Pirellulales bacterium]
MDVLEQELRQQEDYIYELEDYLVEYSDKLRRARCTNLSDSGTGTKKSNPSIQSAQPEIILDGDDLGGLPDDIPEDIPILPQPEIEDNPESATPLLITPPAENQQSPTPDDFDDFEVPDVEIEDPGANHLNGASLPWPIADVETNVSNPLQVATSTNPLMIPNPVGYRSILERPLSDSPEYPVHQAAKNSANPNSQESADPSANPSIDGPSADAQAWDSSTLGNAFEEEETAAIDRIVIQQLLHQSPSRHPNEGHAPQDSSPQPTTSQRSLLAVVEIRDLTNEPVEAVGKLSLMVMAISASTESIASHLPGRSKPRRIQRWDFSAEEVSLAWQSSSLGDGLHLEMPLAAERLPQESLELWARLVTIDGQKHLTKRPFHPQQLVAWQNPPLVTPEDEISPVIMEGAIRLTDSTTQERTSPLRKESHHDRLQPIQHQATIPHHAIGATGITPQWRAAQTQALLPARIPAASGTSPRWMAQAATDQSRTN